MGSRRWGPAGGVYLAFLKRRLLHVGLLVQDAELVVAIDELDAGVVALLNRRLVPLLELEHVLECADDAACTHAALYISGTLLWSVACAIWLREAIKRRPSK